MPIPDLCILECVITGYYKLMNVIITRESMYNPSACVWNGIDKQYDVLAVSVVNTGCAFPALTLPNGRERKPGGDTSLALRKNNDAITLLQEGSLLNLAVLLSSYGSLKSLVSSLCAFIQSYDVINRMYLLTFPWRSAIWLELQYICSGDRSGIGIRPDPRAARSGLASPD